MNIVRIIDVKTSKLGNKYGVTASGDQIFPAAKGETLEKGKFVIFRENWQTQDSEGNSLEGDARILRKIAASSWDSLEEAIYALREPELIEAKANALVKRETLKLEREFSAEEALSGVIG